MPSLHANTGAKRAREARADLSLGEGPIADLIDAVESRAPLIIKPFPEQFAGAVRRDGERALIFVNGAHHPVRRRFTLAHEFGHIRCGHDADTIVDTVTMVTGGDTSSVEVQANAFAAEFLVPAAALKGEPDEPNLEAVVRLACEYGVSAIVVLFRFRTLGKVTDGRAERIQREITEGHHRELAEHLGLTPMEDTLSRLSADELPYVSRGLTGTALGSALSGHASIESAARAAGTTARRLSEVLT